MLEVKNCKPLDKKAVASLTLEFVNRKSHSKGTKETYKKQLKKFFNYCSSKKLQKPRRKDILEFLDKQIYQGKSANYINNLLTVLKNFFRYLDFIKRYEDITKMIDRIKSDKGHKREALHPHQFQKIMKYMPMSEHEILFRNFAILNTLGRTGIRRNGLRELKVKHLFQKEGSDQKQNWYLLVKLKGHQVADHKVLLTEKTLKPIQDYLQLKRCNKPDDYLFSTESGKGLNVDFISRLFKQSARRVGIDSPKITCHSLRHMFATIAKSNDMAMEDISDVLGHAELSTTSDIYVHRGEVNKNKVLKSVDEVLG
ncbi:MAG: tyrosine-type recombinase/integrase [Candidatus Cloacimonetes bacterium]|nr:tyrosine-type recombinase/integrase [Candidatus Cloacimonadota bacterium]